LKINNRKIGSAYENIAKEYLINEGYTIVESNHINKCGEIDIIATKDEILVFCEVKYRTNMLYGDPLEAVDFRKQKKITRTAMLYCTKNNIYMNKICRFDVIAIYGNKHIEHIKNAFYAI
jgi:putative endonuclease